MYALIQKVLEEMQSMVKKRCRHSDDSYTVIAYVCHERTNGRPFIRLDIYKK